MLIAKHNWIPFISYFKTNQILKNINLDDYQFSKYEDFMFTDESLLIYATEIILWK